MATKLSISDLGDILAFLQGFTEPYQLGIQLKIDPSKLDEIEKNQTEVIKHWLRNSSNVSWTSLATAVERVGGYGNVVETLRENDASYIPSPIPSSEPQKTRLLSTQESAEMSLPETRMISSEDCLDDCLPRSILILGKMGHGKSMIGNRMLNSDRSFRINSQKCPQTCDGSALLKSAS